MTPDPGNPPDDELREIAQALQSQSDREHRVLAEAERAVDQGADKVATFMAARRAELAARRPAVSARRRWLWALTAAAAAVAAGVWLMRSDEPRRGPPQLLGHREIELLTPVGDRASFERFEWRPIEGVAVEYEVEVRNARDPSTARPGVEGPVRGLTMRTSWSPTSPLPEAWVEIEWTVRALQADRTEVGVGTARARRGS